VTPKLYKASEVCEATGLQPYVLRSWEKEFPGIGVQKSDDSPRLYRQADVDQVLRIKQLVFVEGLTLAGARRRLGEGLPRAEAAAVDPADDVLDTLGADARSRIELVRTGLRSILHVLSRRAGMTTLPELPRNGSRRETTLRAVKPANGGRAARSSASAGSTGRSRPSASAKPAKRAAATKRSGTVQKAKTGKRKRTSA
jgi:DNA-binding transcriptional MerR regulator